MRETLLDLFPPSSVVVFSSSPPPVFNCQYGLWVHYANYSHRCQGAAIYSLKYTQTNTEPFIKANTCHWDSCWIKDRPLQPSLFSAHSIPCPRDGSHLTHLNVLFIISTVLLPPLTPCTVNALLPTTTWRSICFIFSSSASLLSHLFPCATFSCSLHSCFPSWPCQIALPLTANVLHAQGCFPCTLTT